MRHYKKGRKLGTDTSHTKAMKKSLVCALLANDRIKTIDSRAKAADEGLQVGDVIVAVDGTPTPTMDDVNEVKEDKKAGDKITLTVYRISTGKRLNVTITLMDAHDLEGEDPAAQDAQSQQDDGSQYYQSPFPFFGW